MSENYELTKQLVLLAELEFIDASHAKQKADEQLEAARETYLSARRRQLMSDLPADLSSLRDELHKDPMEDLVAQMDALAAKVHDVQSDLESVVASALPTTPNPEETPNPQPEAPVTEVSL